MQFWFTMIHSGSEPTGPHQIEEVFGWNVKFLLLCTTQDELNELQGWQLMFGRKLEIETFEGWKKRARESRDLNNPGPTLRLPPIVISTFRPPRNNFRGL